MVDVEAQVTTVHRCPATELTSVPAQTSRIQRTDIKANISQQLSKGQHAAGLNNFSNSHLGVGRQLTAHSGLLGGIGCLFTQALSVQAHLVA